MKNIDFKIDGHRNQKINTFLLHSSFQKCCKMKQSFLLTYEKEHTPKQKLR